MKISKSLLIFLLIISTSLFSQAKFKQSRLDENAKTKGYGYKTANLMELEKLAKDISLPGGYQVKVPEFVGITSNQIQEFFQKNGLNIQNRWKEIIPSMDLDDPLEYLEDSENRKNFILKSEKLAKDIESLSITNPKLDLEKVSNFLNLARKDNWRLMVRSTGKEDTKELPNAGGNHSEPNVSPDEKDVINAIKKVTASYFKEKSLSQRINAGDQEIFADPLTPVLLQRMIGEQINGAKKIEDIPVGCVVYTKDVEGGMEDVVVIQAAFGHNEGVVNSEVAVDTYYVKDKNIRPVLQKKNQRIVPIQTEDDFGLQLINNPATLKEKQVLDDVAILAIDSVAIRVHEYYREGTDIELVYEPKTKIIYLVQARPLQVRSAIEASYITNLKNIPEENIAKCSTVSASGGAVRNITNKNQIITGSSLEEALQIYLSGGLDQTQISAVIVKGQAEPTSHAAAIFRGAGKAILTCDEIEKLNNWLDKEKIDLLVDTQREVVVTIENLMDFRGKNLKELIDENLIKIGWFKHPISQRLTISEVKPFFGPYKPAKRYIYKTRRELIEIMKEGSQENAIEALNTLLHKFHSLIFAPETERTKKTLKNFKKLYNVATRLSQEMLDQKIFEKPARDLSRLYSINFLEALLFQPSQTNKYVNVFSVRSVMKEYEEDQTFIKNKLIPLLGKEKAQKIASDVQFLHFARAGCDELYTDGIQKKWLNFVYDVFISTEKKKNIFIKLLTETENFDILPAWINISFSSQVRYSQTSIEILENLNNEYKKVESTLKILKSKKEQLESYDISKWSDPSKFEQTLKNFQKTFLNYYTSDELINLAENNTESQLVFIVLTALMNKFVNIFDESIKELKGSMQYTDKIGKVENFKTILGEYLKLFEKWVALIPEGSIKYYKKDEDWSLNNYLNKIKEIFYNLKIEEKQLIPTPDFSVGGALLGSKVLFSYHFPETLEDIFMLIHQNLLVINGVIFKNYCDISSINKTRLFSDIEKVISNIFAHGEETVLISVLFEKDKIIFKYNQPLAHHSLLFDLFMNKNGTSSVRYKFVGDNAYSRWSRIGSSAFILSFIDDTQFKLNSYSSREVIFTTTFSDKSNLSSLRKEVDFYIKMTCVIDESPKLFILNFENKLGEKLIPIIGKLFYNSQELPKNVIRALLRQIFEILLRGESGNLVKGISFLETVFKDGSEKQKAAALQVRGPVCGLIKAGNDQGVNKTIEIIKKVFESNSEEQKVAALRGSICQLIEIGKNKKQVLEILITILNKVFKEGSKEQKEVSLQSGGSLVGLINTKNDQAISVAIDIIKKVFKEGSEDQKKIALQVKGPVFELIKTRNKEAVSVAIEILKKVFKKGSEEQKIKAWQMDGYVFELITTKNKEVIDAVINILNKIFKEGSENLKVAALQQKGLVPELIRMRKEEVIIDAVINILDKVFEGDSEEQKVAALNGCVFELLETKNKKAFNAVIDILNKVFKEGLDDQKNTVLYRISFILKQMSDRDLAINILNKIFEMDLDDEQKRDLLGDVLFLRFKRFDEKIKFLKKAFEKGSEELKIMALRFDGSVSKLIETGKSQAINAIIEILKEVFDKGSEKQKVAVLIGFGPVLKLIETGNDQAIKVAIEILNKVFKEGSEKQREASLLAGKYVCELIKIGKEPAIDLAKKILNKVFEKGSIKQKRLAINSMTKLIETGDDQVINMVIDVLKGVFEKGSEKQKVAALEVFELALKLIKTGKKKAIEPLNKVVKKVLEDDVYILIATGDDQAINSAITILNKVFEGDLEGLQISALLPEGPITKLIEIKNDKAIDAVIKIFNKVFEGSSDELKKTALEKFGLVYDLIGSDSDKAIKVATNILKKVFEKGSEKQKEEALQPFGPMYELIKAGSEEAINVVIDILNEAFDKKDYKEDKLKPLIKKLIAKLKTRMSTLSGQTKKRADECVKKYETVL